MTKSHSLVALAVAASLAAAWPASAQTPPADPHHSTEGAVPSQTPPAAQPPAPGSSGMMMMQGGDMPMAGMMNMMRQGGMSMSDMAMPGMDMADRVEGRIAFLRAELKVTDAQTKVWNDFAQALRDNAKKLGGMRTMMGPPTGAQSPTLTQRLDQQEQWYAALLEGIRATKVAFSSLYDALSAEQKKTADQIMAPHIGLMPMAAMSLGGMPSGGGMPMGNTPAQRGRP